MHLLLFTTNSSKRIAIGIKNFMIFYNAKYQQAILIKKDQLSQLSRQNLTLEMDPLKYSSQGKQQQHHLRHMQKYLQKRSKQHSLKDTSVAKLHRLRRMLQHNEKIQAQFVNSVLEEDRIAAARQILFFRRYQQFKKIIHKHISQRELQTSRELGAIFDEYMDGSDIADKKGNDQIDKKPHSNRKKSSYSHAQLKKIIFSTLGVIFFVLCIIKREKLKTILKKLLP